MGLENERILLLNVKRWGAALALATAIAAPMEGTMLNPYRDPTGKLTVCMGSTTDIDPTKTYTYDECKIRMESDMLAFIAKVEECRPGLPLEVLAAFSDASYNLGERVACDTRTSTAARYLASGEYDKACHELVRWNMATVLGIDMQLPGLTRRRKAEMELCLTWAG